MANVESNSIRIFPSTDRGSNTNAYLDNFVTEYNLSSIVNKLLKSSGVSANTERGFLITTSLSYPTQVLEFNIAGYFITTTPEAILNGLNGTTPETGAETAYENFVRFSVRSNKVVAEISIMTNVGNYQYSQIGGQDGVNINDSDSGLGGTAPITYTLPIFNVSGTSGSYEYDGLCEESKLRFNNINIDDGVL